MCVEVGVLEMEAGDVLVAKRQNLRYGEAAAVKDDRSGRARVADAVGKSQGGIAGEVGHVELADGGVLRVAGGATSASGRRSRLVGIGPGSAAVGGSDIDIDFGDGIGKLRHHHGTGALRLQVFDWGTRRADRIATNYQPSRRRT